MASTDPVEKRLISGLMKCAIDQFTRFKQMKIFSVVGARPNFMKIAPLARAFRKYPSLEMFLVHTGQHYDKLMSDIFFDQLELPKPYRHLGVGSGGHGEMTGKIMIEFEKVCIEERPDLVIVVGDVNSTIATALVARKLFIPVAHVESGLRSFDETMPEELNRRLTDCISNLLFVSEPSGMNNLQREGIMMERAHLVGDIMLQTLQMFWPHVLERKRASQFNLSHNEYALVTIHRPSNVDNPESLKKVIDILASLPIPTIFPAHPRTLDKMKRFGLTPLVEKLHHVRFVAPESYFDFLSLLSDAKLVLSDSGSIQAEASFLDVPCLVCRENTERPIYIEEGACTLVGLNTDLIRIKTDEIMSGLYKSPTQSIKTLGDNVGEKIAEIIFKTMG